jgi:hypothetical protein
MAAVPTAAAGHDCRRPLSAIAAIFFVAPCNDLQVFFLCPSRCHAHYVARAYRYRPIGFQHICLHSSILEAGTSALNQIYSSSPAGFSRKRAQSLEFPLFESTSHTHFHEPTPASPGHFSAHLFSQFFKRPPYLVRCARILPSTIQ